MNRNSSPNTGWFPLKHPGCSLRRVVPWLACSLLALSAGAVPLNKEEIPANVKWLLHFDLDEFRSTKVGSYVCQEILVKRFGPQLADLQRKLQFNFDPSRLLEKIRSITAFGTDYRSPKDSAVLLIKADPDVQTALVGGLAALALAGTNAPVAVTQQQQGNLTFYSVRDEVFLAIVPNQLIAIGKSRGITQKTAEVLGKKSPNLKSSQVFSEFADLKKTFFFLGVAEGFNSDNALPPQAKLLQMADGGRVVLGETANRLFLDLALKARTSEIVTQMQQVVQGTIALGSLGQPQNQDLAQLLQAVKVTTHGKIVSVSVDYPIDRALEKLAEQKEKGIGHSDSNRVEGVNAEAPRDQKQD